MSTKVKLQIENVIVEKAKGFVGKREIAGNQGFHDEEVDKVMRKIGNFQNGEAWCAIAGKVIWKLAYAEFNSFMLPLLDFFSKGAVKTYNNAAKKTVFETSPDVPKVGAIVVWQKYVQGKADWRGHLGIVTRVEGDDFYTVEGNTSARYGDRNGDGFYVKFHNVSKEKVITKGLRLKGFIYPADLTPIEIEKALA